MRELVVLSGKTVTMLEIAQMPGNGEAGDMINLVSACIQKRMTAENLALFQLGTHPALTASRVVYHLVNAPELTIAKMEQH